MYDFIIRNGTVVTSDAEQKADIGIRNGMIEELSASIQANAENELDAAGLHIFPGAVDIHVHFSEPGRSEWEGFRSDRFKNACVRWDHDVCGYAAQKERFQSPSTLTRRGTGTVLRNNLDFNQLNRIHHINAECLY